jgi:hypothetical protein
VVTDLVVQFGVLASVTISETLERPLRHILFLMALMTVVTVFGWAVGAAIRSILPFGGIERLLIECALWLAVMAASTGPLANRKLRERLAGLIPG